MRNLYTKITLLLTLSICLSNAFGQIILTSQNNAPVAGDSSRTREVVYVSPGAAGENQVWDFSAIQVSGKTSYRGVSEDMTHKMAGPGERNIVLAEDGYEYSYICSENSIREIGYANPGKKMTLGYDTPLVQMKYPFSFGQQFAQPCSGIAWYHDRSRDRKAHV